MAPWVMHLRVAEIVNELLKVCDETAYYVGSIAPDSGKLNGDFGYTPPKDISHWKREGTTFDERLKLNAEFYTKYIKNERDPRRLSFLLGYYVHILTDSFFVREVIRPYIDKYGHDVWRADISKLRATWYEIDFRFLAEHPGYKPLELLSKVDEFPNTYFDYFTYDDITNRVRDTYALYSSHKPDKSLPLLGLDEQGADEFVVSTAEEIKKLLAISD